MNNFFQIKIDLSHIEAHALLQYFEHSDFETKKKFTLPQSIMLAMTIKKIIPFLKKSNFLNLELTDLEAEALSQLIKYHDIKINQFITESINLKIKSSFSKLKEKLPDNCGKFERLSSELINEYLRNHYKN